MLDPVMVFREGGPFMYLLLLCAIFLPFAVFIPAITGGLKLRAPAVLWFGIALLPLSIGALGSYLGFGMVIDACRFASREMVAPLAANGLSVGMYTLLAGSALSALLLAALALSVGIGAAIGVGGNRRFTPLTALPPLLVGLLALATVFAGSWLGPVVGLLAASGLVLASLQASDEDAHNERLAAARATAGLLGASALVLVALQTSTLSGTMAFNAQATASAEMKALLIARATEGLWVRNLLLLGATIAATLATAVAVAPMMKQLFTKRTGLSALVVPVVLSPLLLLLVATAWRGSTAFALTVDAGVGIAEDLAAQGFELPTVTDELDKPVFDGPILVFSADGVTYEGEPVTPSSFVPPAGEGRRRGELWIQATPRTELGQIQPYGPALGKVNVRWMARNADGLRGLDLTPQSGPERDAGDMPDRFRELGQGPSLVAIHRGGIWSVGVRDEDSLRPFDTGPELRPILAQAAQETRGGAVHVWFEPAATVQELMDVASATIELSGEPDTWNADEPDLSLVWRLDDAPSLDAVPKEDPGEEGGDDDDAPSSGDVGSSAPTIRGAIDASLVQRVVRRHMNQIRYCYQRELTKDPGLEGRMEVKFVIAKDGSVSSATTQSTTMNSPAVESCVVGRFQRMVFPEPKGGGIAIVQYPIVFSPG